MHHELLLCVLAFDGALTGPREPASAHTPHMKTYSRDAVATACTNEQREVLSVEKSLKSLN